MRIKQIVRVDCYVQVSYKQRTFLKKVFTDENCKLASSFQCYHCMFLFNDLAATTDTAPHVF